MFCLFVSEKKHRQVLNSQFLIFDRESTKRKRKEKKSREEKRAIKNKKEKLWWCDHSLRKRGKGKSGLFYFHCPPTRLEVSETQITGSLNIHCTASEPTYPLIWLRSIEKKEKKRILDFVHVYVRMHRGSMIGPGPGPDYISQQLRLGYEKHLQFIFFLTFISIRGKSTGKKTDTEGKIIEDGVRRKENM